MKEKRKARGRFNVLDVVLVLLAVLCIVGVWQRESIRNLFDSGENLDGYTVTFEVRKMRKNVFDCLGAEQAVYLDDNGVMVSFGRIAEQPVDHPAVDYLPNQNGEMVEAVYPDDDYEYLLDVTGQLSCRGLAKDGSFYLEGKTALTVNQTVSVYTENADFEIRILSIARNE